jgi:hypothetical protein
VDNETEKIIRAMTTAGIVGSLAAAVRALVVDRETPWQRVRTFFAGVFLSLFLGYALMDAPIGEFYRTLIIGGRASFISTIWPILERLAKKWVTKKGENVVSNNDDK